MNKKTLCETCQREISNNNYKKHINSCKGIKIERQETKIKEEWLQINGKYKCPYCFKEYTKQGLGTHIWRKHTIDGQSFNNNNIGRVAWNKGLTKGTDKRVKSYGKTLSTKYEKGELKIQPIKNKKVWKEKLSLATTKNHNGGYKTVPYIDYTLKSGKVIKLRGTYEIRFAEFLDKNNIEWNYQNAISYINKEGITKHCLPDFYIPSLDKYIDTKGALTEDFAEKIQLIKEQKDITIHLVYNKDLEAIENGLLKIEDI